jgi:hypothetical protein
LSSALRWFAHIIAPVGIFGNNFAAGIVCAALLTNDTVQPMEVLTAQLRTAKQVAIYQQQPLPKRLLRLLKELVSAEVLPTVEIVAENPSDVTYLRDLHSVVLEKK